MEKLKVIAETVRTSFGHRVTYTVINEITIICEMLQRHIEPPKVTIGELQKLPASSAAATTRENGEKALKDLSSMLYKLLAIAKTQRDDQEN